jgi:hypothetical protein
MTFEALPGSTPPDELRALRDEVSERKIAARADEELESLTEGSSKPIWFQPEFTRLWARRGCQGNERRTFTSRRNIPPSLIEPIGMSLGIEPTEVSLGPGGCLGILHEPVLCMRILHGLSGTFH